MRREKKSVEISPKTQPIRGSLMAQYKRCGRDNCRCAKDFKHGPFFYHVWYVQGERFKKYVRKSDFDRIKASIEAFQAQRREQQQSRAEIEAILRENREARRNLYAILRGIKL